MWASRITQATVRKCFVYASLLVPAVSALAENNPSGPAEIAARSRLEQKLNGQVPLELAFCDESGQTRELGVFFGKRPVILVLAYYQCPGLCTLVLNALLAGVQDLRLNAGSDFEVVIVSIDSRETPALAMEKKRAYSRRYARASGGEGWHFLTGQEKPIAQLAQSVGFRFTFDASTRQFAHPSALMILTPEGRVSRYFAGIEYPPKELRLAIVEASHHQIGSLTDRLFLLCYHYNPETGKYGLAIVKWIRITCITTVLVVGCGIALLLRGEYRATRALHHDPT